MDISKLLTKSRPISLRFIFKHINNRKFKMSLSAATNSDFICTLLENEDILDKLTNNECNIESTCFTFECNENEYIIEYVIPFEFYRSMREIDANWFIALWEGRDQYYESRYDMRKINVTQVANLARAMLLNENLHFVQQLNTHYPPYTKENSSPPYTFMPPLASETS
jgi:hemolysin-activating ACP:hemolysin acyltransferase